MISKAGKGSTIAYWLGAVIILAALLGGVLAQRVQETAGKDGVEVLLLGDSVLAQSAVGELLAEQGPYDVANCAIGGTMLSAGQQGSDTEFQDMKNTLCMVALTKSICSCDFGAQKATRVKEPILNYLPATIGTLASISLEKTKVLIFNHGVNDFYRAVELDDPQNPMNIATFGGALRQVLSDLQETYPRLRIIYVTPPYAWYDNGTITCEEKDYGHGPLENYVNLALEICREYQVETVDIYHDLYDITRPDADRIYTLDGLHPSEEGAMLIALKIAEAIGTE